MTCIIREYAGKKNIISESFIINNCKFTFVTFKGIQSLKHFEYVEKLPTKFYNNYFYSCVESKRCNDNRDANGLVTKSGGFTIRHDIDAAQNGKCPKGGLISESFSFWLKFSKMGAKSLF